MFKRLLIFLLPLIFLMGCCIVPAEKSFSATDKQIIVYYFYAKPRCISCKNIESYTKETVASLNNKNIKYKEIDLDNPTNKHYKKEYKLFTKSVVLSKVQNGKEIKSKNLTEIWTKLSNEKAFKAYLTKEIKSF